MDIIKTENKNIPKRIQNKENEIVKNNTYDFRDCTFIEIDDIPCMIVGNIIYYNIMPVAIPETEISVPIKMNWK